MYVASCSFLVIFRDRRDEDERRGWMCCLGLSDHSAVKYVGIAESVVDSELGMLETCGGYESLSMTVTPFFVYSSTCLIITHKRTCSRANSCRECSAYTWNLTHLPLELKMQTFTDAFLRAPRCAHSNETRQTRYRRSQSFKRRKASNQQVHSFFFRFLHSCIFHIGTWPAYHLITTTPKECRAK